MAIVKQVNPTAMRRRLSPDKLDAYMARKAKEEQDEKNGSVSNGSVNNSSVDNGAVAETGVASVVAISALPQPEKKLYSGSVVKTKKMDFLNEFLKHIETHMCI